MAYIEDLLAREGPMRGSEVAKRLVSDLAVSPEAARKRISRTSAPVRRFPVQLLPKRESFLYLNAQRKTELFWTSFHSALRSANSVYGHAIDGLLARGGVVPAHDFEVVSGAPRAMKRQVCSGQLLGTLIAAGVAEKLTDVDLGDCVAIARPELGLPDFKHARAIRLAEGVVLDGVREWVRKLGLGSYNAVRIRDEDGERRVGQFSWDLTAPSYLAPMKRDGGQPGFVAADVFVGEPLDEFQIRYFLRKVELVSASIRSHILPILIADGFSPSALRQGKRVGVLMATPTNLFGRRVGEALRELVGTLKNAATVAASDPAKLARLVEGLSEIEGAAGNLRGILFELIVAHLAKLHAVSVDVGVTARDPTNGKTANIDVFKVESKSVCSCIECKGKGPGGEVTIDEVDAWLRRIPTFRSHLSRQERFREAKQSFELWTTGKFAPDALARLEVEKTRRTRWPIDWKDGNAVSEAAKSAKEKAIRVALDEHFLKHPLSRV